MNSIKSSCTELLGREKFCESDMLKVQQFESLKVSLQSLDIDVGRSIIEKNYSKDLLSYSKKSVYWETEFLENHALRFLCGAASNDCKILVNGGYDSTIRVWYLS